MMKEFSSCVIVSAVTTGKINALRATEMQRLANVKERRSACEIGIMVNDVLTDLDIVDEWLRENHESPRAGKVFVMFINEGMTSIQQVADIGINFNLKKAIKGRYQAFRDSAVEGLTISELAGSVIAVSREDLFEMVETTIDDINTKNRPQVDRRHICTVWW